MGCSVRVAGNPGRTKEHRIERLTVNIAPRAKRKTRRVGYWPVSTTIPRNRSIDADGIAETDPGHFMKCSDTAGNGSRCPDLALQLRFLRASESMGNHDSKIVDAGSVD